MTHPLLPGSPVYLVLMLAALIGGATWWSRKFRSDSRLMQIFAGGIVGAFAGAKIAFLFAEGWIHRGSELFWLQIAGGKTILGGLLGGYLAVEAVKMLTGYRRPTGDWFAAAVPLGIALGRIGCLAHGCCRGVVCRPAWYTVTDIAGSSRWPAPVAEVIFNLVAASLFLQMRRAPRPVLPGQHFHLYLIAYGLFRFAHEFVRDTPRLPGSVFSGYHVLALLAAGLGVWGFWRRAREGATAGSSARSREPG